MADISLKKKKTKKDDAKKNVGKDTIDFNPTTDGTQYEHVLTIPQRMARGRQLRRMEPKLERSRELARLRMADSAHLKKRARSQAKNALRRKVAGNKGANYATLSASEKIQIDKMVEKRGKKAIERLSKKLLPRVRQAEMARLSAVRGSSKVFNAGKKPVEHGKSAMTTESFISFILRQKG